MVSNDIFFLPFSTLDMYCWVQFIFSASICCVKPSSVIRFDMAAAINYEYSAQSFLSCFTPVSCFTASKAIQGILSVVVFIERLPYLVWMQR